MSAQNTVDSERNATASLAGPQSGQWRAPGVPVPGKDGGAEEDRTPDLRIANATLSQLSYGPVSNTDSTSIVIYES